MKKKPYRKPKVMVIAGMRGIGKTHEFPHDYSVYDNENDVFYKADPITQIKSITPIIESEQKSVLKSVYCNYRGYVIVYDVHGQKVHELSGLLTYEKYLEIEERSLEDITEFEGIDDYRCIVCELKKKADPLLLSSGDLTSILSDSGTWERSFDPLEPPIKKNPSYYEKP
jgi:hypothetical protein